MKRKRIRFVLPALIILTLLTIAGMSFYAIYLQRKAITISHESGIYHEAIELSLESIRPATILYTQNGEKPTLEDEDTMTYTEPLQLEMGNETSTYSFQFMCVYKDGSTSEIYTRDFIMEEVIDRFTTTYVVSITGDEEALFGYEEGVFVRGRQYDEYMAENPDVDILGTIIPANYFSEEEIPVHAAIYTQDGSSIISQDCGLKIYGNVTRAKNQKSFRLTARYDYDSVNEFTYAFLPKLVSDKTNTVIDEYQRLSFHNAGNDHGYGFVRTELIAELARKAGFPDVLVSESVTVYVNGKYQGVYWLQNAFDDRYFEEKYGEYDGVMVVCEGELGWMSEENVEDIYEKSYTVHYNDFCLWIRDADLQNEENWKRVCDTIDINNFAQYMAIEYYINNIDWPQNNVKVYRYVNDNGDYYEGTVFDGKYRYLLFDTDYGMGLKFLGWYGADETGRRLGELIDYQPLFGSLMEREEFKNAFINAVLCLMNESFAPEEVTQTLNEFNEKRLQELQYMMEGTDLLKNSLWEGDDNNMNNVHQEWNEIIQFAENRNVTVISELDEKLACGQPMDVTVRLSAEGSIKLGGLDVGAEYNGYWLENVPMEISCDTLSGYLVTGYYVNEEYIEGATISLMPGDWKKNDGKLEIEPVLVTNEIENLCIASYDVDGPEDYVVLKNDGQTDILLSDYYITDSEEDPSKGSLPSVTLEPGDEFVVYGIKYTGEFEDNSIQVSFSWNEEEAVYLFHQTNGIMEIVTR